MTVVHRGVGEGFYPEYTQSVLTVKYGGGSITICVCITDSGVSEMFIYKAVTALQNT